LQEDESRYYVTSVIKKNNDRLKLATVSWVKEPLESWLARIESHMPAIMAAPGGDYSLPKILEGGCADNTWAATAAPPEARSRHTAVWTGSEMIIWGGQSNGGLLDTGGRYNPAHRYLDIYKQLRRTHRTKWPHRDMDRERNDCLGGSGRIESHSC